VIRLGEISDQWVIVYVGQFFITKVAHILGNFSPQIRLCNNFDKKWVGLNFERFF
jgi:hypothetical protein